MAIETGVMHQGKTLRDFFEEAVRCNVPGLPYVSRDGRIVARVSVRDVYKRLVVPDHLIGLADVIGDQTDMLDLVEMHVTETLTAPVEPYLLGNITAVAPRTSIVKALALMEMHNSSYVFLVEDGEYKGVVTRMVIADRMLRLIKEHEQQDSTS